MQHKVSIWTKIALTCLLIACMALILAQLPELSDIPQLKTAKVREIVEPIEIKVAQEKAMLEKEKLILQRIELRKREDELQAARAYIPTKFRIRAAWGYALIGAFISLFLAIAIGVAIAFVKVSLANSDAIAMAFLSRKLSPQMLALEKEKYRYMTQELKAWGVHKDAPILPEMKDVTPTQTPDALQCIERGLIAGGQPAFFFGVTHQGEPQYEDILRGKTGIAVIGAQGVGKTNNFVNMGVQAILKGWLILIVDLHFPDEQSLTYKLGDVAELPNVKYFSEHEDVLPTMWFLNNLVEMRLKGKLPKDPPILVNVDELLNLITLFDDEAERKPILQAFTRLTTEGRKNKIYLMAGSHSWKVQDLGSSTFRNNMLYRMAFRADRDDIRTLTKKKRLVDMCESLEDGECVYTTPQGKIRHVQQPLWTPDAIQKAASMVSPVAWPDIANPTTDQLDDYARKVVNLSDKRAQLKQEAMNLKHGECKHFAEQHGIDPHTVSRWRQGT